MLITFNYSLSCLPPFPITIFFLSYLHNFLSLLRSAFTSFGQFTFSPFILLVSLFLSLSPLDFSWQVCQLLYSVYLHLFLPSPSSVSQWYKFLELLYSLALSPKRDQWQEERHDFLVSTISLLHFPSWLHFSHYTPSSSFSSSYFSC